MRKSIFLLAIIFLGSLGLSAQTADKLHIPAQKSAERQAILEALREGQNITFKVYYLKVHSGWAWIDTTPFDAQTKKSTAEGGPSLLHLENGKWRVMDL